MPRNRSIKSGVACGVTAVMGLFFAQSSANAAPATSSWTQPGYNGARNQANLTEKTLTVGNVPSVGLRRKYTGLPKSPGNDCFSADGGQATNSVISGGYLYTSIHDAVARTSLKTGVTSWRRDPLPANERAEEVKVELAVSGNIVIVTFLDCESQSAPDADVFALNATSGATVWTDSSEPATEHISVSGSYLILSGGTDTDGSAITVYKLATGVMVWQHFPGFTCNSVGQLTAIVEGGQVISCYGDDEGGPNTIEADSLATGSVTWTRAADELSVIRGDTDAVATGHQLYLNTPDGIIDVNPKNGDTKFTMAGATSIDAVSGTTVYGTCGSNLCAFNIAFGSLAWSVPNPTTGNISAWADDVIYMSDGSSINDSNGVVLTHSRIAGQVVVGDGYVIVGGDSSHVVDIYGLPNS